MKFLVVAVFACYTFVTLGQGHNMLVRFNAIADDDRIIVNWTIARNQSCIGIGIFRSSDGINYVKIGEIQGICGSTDEDQPFTYIDENPFVNSYNYYKLELGFNGQSQASDPVYFFSLVDNASRAFPNPTKEYSYIYFSNPSNLPYNLWVYSSESELVSHQSTNQEFFILTLTPQQLGNSKYVFYVITNKFNEKIASGRILTISH